MTCSNSMETIIDINNNYHHSSSVVKRCSTYSTETNRHIKFDDIYNEKQERRQTLTHTDFIHASENEILHRYLSYFEQNLPKYIKENFANEVNIENYRLSNSRMHHKDDIELYHLKRIQMIFESIEKPEKTVSNRDVVIIIDAFHIYVENMLRKQFFINQCKIEQQENKNQLLSIIDINYSDLFTMILSSFNRICHSPLHRMKSSRTAEILIVLFQDIFSNMKEDSSRKTLSLLIDNYHRLHDSAKQKPISSSSTINNFRNNINRKHLFSQSVLLKTIEESTVKCPHNIQLFHSNYIPDSTKKLLSTIFSQSLTSNHERYSFENHNDCIEVFLNIVKQNS